MSIRIYYDDTDFRVEGWRKIVRIIELIIGNENKVSGELSYIITGADSLRKINREFLDHDYDTDVISFNYNDGRIINGEIYVSIEVVRENAINYNVSFRSELLRVLFHGVLHLLGYDDKTKEQKAAMREMEDMWLAKIEE